PPQRRATSGRLGWPPRCSMGVMRVRLGWRAARVCATGAMRSAEAFGPMMGMGYGARSGAGRWPKPRPRPSPRSAPPAARAALPGYLPEYQYAKADQNGIYRAAAKRRLRYLWPVPLAVLCRSHHSLLVLSLRTK